VSIKLTEEDIEAATIEWFRELGYTPLHGAEISPNEPQAERQNYNDVVLIHHLQNALETINPHIPLPAIQDAIKKITRTETPILYENNRCFHKYLTDGVDVEYQQNGRTKYEKVWLMDFSNIHNNDWLVVKSVEC